MKWYRIILFQIKFRNQCKIYLPVERTCKETIVKEIFKLISELPSQTLTNGKSQDELGYLK